MEEINNGGSVVTDLHNITYTGDLTSQIIHDEAGQVPLGLWQQAQPQPSPIHTFGSYVSIEKPTIESLESQIQFLEGTLQYIKRQLAELKEENKKYPPRKLGLSSKK